ncbi:MAG: modulated transcriptional regulator, LuxR family, partial [Frankiales bacterium]|nr:modulated transcriptional regulator, LuxR family [Frankiales bacterium]
MSAGRAPVRLTSVAPPVATSDVQVGWLAAGVRDVTASDTVDDAESRRLYEALGAVPGRVLDAVAQGDSRPDEAAEVAGVAGVLQGLLRTHVRETGTARYARVHEVLEEVCREAGQNELTASCASALCDAGGFDRALVSRVEGSSWAPGVLHVAGVGPAPLGGRSVSLVSGLPETEAVRRRLPALVPVDPDGWAEHPLAGAGVETPYLVAPLVTEGRVIGLLHADNALTGRLLTQLDRDVLQMFADGFTRAYERATLLERVVRQREQIRATLSTPSAVGAGLDPAAVRFTRARAAAAAAPARIAGSAVEVHDETSLTAREHEILALLATGATNLEIADRL